MQVLVTCQAEHRRGLHLPRTSQSPNLYKSSLLAAEGPGLTWYFALDSLQQVLNAFGHQQGWVWGVGTPS